MIAKILPGIQQLKANEQSSGAGSLQHPRLAQGVENHWLGGHARCAVVEASAGGEVRAVTRIRVDVQSANLDGGAAEEAMFFNFRRRSHRDSLDGHLQRKLHQHLPQTRARRCLKRRIGGRRFLRWRCRQSLGFDIENTRRPRRRACRRQSVSTRSPP